MSRSIIFVLVNHRHKLLELICIEVVMNCRKCFILLMQPDFKKSFDYCCMSKVKCSVNRKCFKYTLGASNRCLCMSLM
jgi:hypothetical protein